MPCVVRKLRALPQRNRGNVSRRRLGLRPGHWRAKTRPLVSETNSFGRKLTFFERNPSPVDLSGQGDRIGANLCRQKSGL
jgi:hypothetical protein